MIYNHHKLTCRPGNAGGMMRIWLKLFWITASISGGPGFATEHTGGQQQSDSSDPVVEYPAAFFALYQPNTALDMVRQVPGFQLDDGGGGRGLAGAAGNILINGRRPSAKQDAPSDILSRIPASQVGRIELIQGQVRGINMQGQAAVANIILLDYVDRVYRWETLLRQTNTGPLKPGLTASMASHWSGFDYMVGINVEREANGEYGVDRVYDGDGNLTETRIDDNEQTGLRLLGIFLNTSTWAGETLLQFNSRFGLLNGPDNTLSSRLPETGNNRQEILFKNSQNVPTFEMGFDAERELGNDLTGKAILLYSYGDRDIRSLQSNHNADGVQTQLRIAESETVSTEGIARLELDWSGISGHYVQFDIETAYNSVDGSVVQTVDTGSGPVVVDIPDGNTRVEEVRGDAVLKDTWSLGRFELDYGVGAEVSTITQSGDQDQDRSFFFVKPLGMLTYSVGQGQQLRFRAERQVSQLNFNDFISAAEFQDDNLALGNPNLRPDKTWVTELGYERRFGRVGVVKVTGFHHWINDVEDLLPLTETDAVPGNIGNGRRWGVELETAVPLDWLGLTEARLDFKTRWQDSSVVDPVTGESRPLSASGGFGGPPTIAFRRGNKYVFDVAYRQDFETALVAWGWDAAIQAERPLYKVDELDVFDEGVEFNAFIETTRWWDLKIRLDCSNILNYTETRVRTFFEGGRGISPVDSIIERERKPGRRLTLSISGSF